MFMKGDSVYLEDEEYQKGLLFTDDGSTLCMRTASCDCRNQIVNPHGDLHNATDGLVCWNCHKILEYTYEISSLS